MIDRPRRTGAGAYDAVMAHDPNAYVRFQGTVPRARGNFPGVFGLVNSLAREGRLTAAQERFRRTHNDWYDAAYTDPSTVDPTVYDERVNPGAAAWFKTTAWN